MTNKKYFADIIQRYGRKIWRIICATVINPLSGMTRNQEIQMRDGRSGISYGIGGENLPSDYAPVYQAAIQDFLNDYMQKVKAPLCAGDFTKYSIAYTITSEN